MLLLLSLACASSTDTGATDTVAVEVVVTPAPSCPPNADPDLRFTRHAGGDHWEDLLTPASIHEAAWGLTVFDADGDGLLDIFVPSFGQDRLFLQLPDGRLADVNQTHLPQGDTPSFGASAADADGDGDLDLLVLRRGPNALLLNQGGVFTEHPVPAMQAVSAESQGGGWGDVDGDGLLEHFAASFYTEDSVEAGDPNELLGNLGGAMFEDLSQELVRNEAWTTPANAGGFFDADVDGDLDLYIINDKPQSGYVSMLLVNDGDGGLTWDRGERGLGVSLEGMGVGVGELNGDGVPDFVVTGWDELALLLSAPGGAWYDAAAAWGLTTDADRVVAWGVELADLDLDGDDDVIVAYGANFDHDGERPWDQYNPFDQPLGVYINEGQRFVERSAEWQLDVAATHRGFVLADINRDGALDLVIQDLRGPPQLYLSSCPERAWMQVSLRGPPPNTHAIGARVTVEAGDRSWWRELHAGSTNIASGGPPVAHFGLGAMERVERVEVRWPDGALTVVEDLPTRSVVELVRSDSVAY